jgi:hypothetical protein
VLPDAGAWADMDFDPGPVFAGVSCPVLAFYGETDAWMPIEDSADAWRRAGEASGNRDITVVRLAGCDHLPTLNERTDLDGVYQRYTSDERMVGTSPGRRLNSSAECNDDAAANRYTRPRPVPHRGMCGCQRLDL